MVPYDVDHNTLETMAARVRHRIETAPDEAVTEGRAWYALAHYHACRIAEDTGYSVRQVAGVIAALSPQNPWEDNLRVAEAVCHGDHSQARTANITTDMMSKAFDILEGIPPRLVLGGPKVRSFYLNILGWSSAVTVDVWASRIALVGDRYKTLMPHVTRRGERKPSRKVRNYLGRKGNYDLIGDAYRLVAAELGWTPMEVQAVAWCAERNDYELTRAAA